MHPSPPALLQTLRRAAALLASRPHLLRSPGGQIGESGTAATAAAAAAGGAARSASASAASAAAPEPPATAAATTKAAAAASTPTTPTTLDHAYLAAARARVFDQVPPPSTAGAAAAAALGGGRRSGRRPMLAPLRGRELNSWYVTAELDVPLLENDEETSRLENVALRKSSGRAPPKKGQGKRSGGKKRK